MKRTSIGNVTGSRRFSTSPITASSASRACSRGIAYSISVKRTARRVANTLHDRSTFVVGDASLGSVASRNGISRGNARPVRAKAPTTAFSSTYSCSHSLRSSTASGGSSERVLERTSATSE